MDKFEVETYKIFINKHVDKLNKQFCKTNPMKVQFSTRRQRVKQKNRTYATYYVSAGTTIFFLPEVTRFILKSLKGLVLHEFGHHIESQLIDDLFLWDLSDNRRRFITGSKKAEYWMREVIADNFGLLVDEMSMIEMWAMTDKLRSYHNEIRMFKKNLDYWFDIFQSSRRRYDVARVLPRGLTTIRKVKEIKQLIRRL